jgi:hypothetical protein
MTNCPKAAYPRFLRHALTLSVAGGAIVLAQCSSSKSTAGTGDGGGGSQGTSGASGATSRTGGSQSSGPGDTSTSEPGGSSSPASSGRESSSSSSPPSPSVLQRGNDLLRHSNYTEPGLTKSAVPMMQLDATFTSNATFATSGSQQNAGTSSVLYLAEGPSAAGCPTGATGCKASARPAGNGLFFAFPASKSTPNVVAFDETTGQAVWTATLMTGNDGIRGTAVIDPSTRRLFVVTGNNPHLVHALSVDNGVEVTTGGWPVTLSTSTLTEDTIPFNSSAQNQHGALLFMNGMLYIPFGGEYGDGGNYRGWVVAVDTGNPSNVTGWVSQSARSGVWGAGGLASDGTSVFAVTGDTTVTADAGSDPRTSSDSEEVVRLTSSARLNRSAENVFVATQWQSWDRPEGDLDFGASTPAYVNLPSGSSPSALLVAPAKAGRVFFLDGTNLSNGVYDANRTPGGDLLELDVSNLSAESVYTAPTIYSGATGLHAAINVGKGATGCPGTAPTTQEAIVSMLIEPGKTPIAKVAWCAAVTNGGGHLNYPPMSTTTDGNDQNAIVWLIDGSQLVALDGDTGARLFTSTGAGCPNVPSMTWPIAAKNRVVVAGLGQICSWSVGGS